MVQIIALIPLLRDFLRTEEKKTSERADLLL